MQNIIKGARYCGKRGGVSFVEATRPQRDSSGKLSCPDGFTVCIDETLDDSGKYQDYAICRPNDIEAADFCPITSFAFDLEFKDENEQEKYK